MAADFVDNHSEYAEGAAIEGVGGHRRVLQITTAGATQDVAVAGNGAVELTLGADLDTATWSGWDSTLGLHQRVAVTVLQDATGNHRFDPDSVAGEWTRRPTTPKTLPGGIALRFAAETDDGGATVRLTPEARNAAWEFDADGAAASSVVAGYADVGDEATVRNVGLARDVVMFTAAEHIAGAVRWRADNSDHPDIYGPIETTPTDITWDMAQPPTGAAWVDRSAAGVILTPNTFGLLSYDGWEFSTATYAVASALPDPSEIHAAFTITPGAVAGRVFSTKADELVATPGLELFLVPGEILRVRIGNSTSQDFPVTLGKRLTVSTIKLSATELLIRVDDLEVTHVHAADGTGTTLSIGAAANGVSSLAVTIHGLVLR